MFNENKVMKQKISSADKNYFLTIKDITEDLAVSERTVYRLIKNGDLPPPVHFSAKIRRWPAQIYFNWKEEYLSRLAFVTN